MSIEDIEKAIKEAEKSAPPMFHPVHERSEGAWFPGNEAASIASIISQAWEDIHCIFEIRKCLKNDYEMKLFFKYIMVELRSILEQLEKLQRIVFQIIKDDPAPGGYISPEEADEVKILFKKYHLSKRNLENDVISIRNNIGAHRSIHSWNDIMDLWDKLDPNLFKNIFIVLPKLFNYLARLDIYDWTRIPEEGCIEICCSGLNKP